MLVSCLLVSGGLARAADPVVTNPGAAQRTGTKLVDISYDVVADVNPVTITLEVSADGGSTWSVPVTAVSGDIGAGIPTGTGKTITWNAGTDWDEQAAGQMRFRVTADDLVEGPPAPQGFVLIPAGAFQMGGPSSPPVGASDELPVHSVSVSAFYLAKQLVTKTLWDEVRAWGLGNGYSDLPQGSVVPASTMGTTTIPEINYNKGGDHPVHLVNWYAMVKWCNARSQKDGLTPCYYLSTTKTAANIYKAGTNDIGSNMVDWSADGYRLPTEAEWEKAARGGQGGQNFPWGSAITHSLANYSSSSLFSYDSSPTRGFHPTYNIGGYPYTSPVGSFAANGYGLYDMAGNAWEACWDWYSASYYLTSPASDPRGATAGSFRMFRGGSWADLANRCRVAYRHSYSPGNSYIGHGFRVAAKAATGYAESGNVAVDTRSVILTLTTPPAGQGDIQGAGSFARNATATVTATTGLGYLFSGWTGDASGTANPLEIVMDADKTIAAGFAPDLADDDGDGLTNYDELVILGTDPHRFDPPLMTLAPAAGNSLALTFLARAASGGLTRIYDVQASPDLAPDSWLGVPGYTNIVGADQTVVVTLPVDAARWFYRLRIRVE